MPKKIDMGNGVFIDGKLESVWSEGKCSVDPEDAPRNLLQRVDGSGGRASIPTEESMKVVADSYFKMWEENVKTKIS